jgi:hypothetical protein
VDKVLEVYGYHGTSQARAASILEGGFLASDNDYDWLGTGIYFFQDAPVRAKQWAEQQHPESPAVLRALLRLENCIDLFDVVWQSLLKEIYVSFVEQYKIRQQPVPTQKPDRSKAHRLDCSFFNYSIDFVASQGFVVESIRAAFIEGSRLYPDSAIFDLAHVQIAIRKPSLIQKLEIIEFSGV